MNKLQMLQDQRNGVARAMRNLRDRIGSRNLDSTEMAIWDSNLAHLDRLDHEIAAADRTADANQLSRLGITERDAACNAYIRGGFGAFTQEQRTQYRNTMSEGTNSQGGYTVGIGVASAFVDALKDYGGVRRFAEVVVTAKGNALSYPTSDGTAETGEQLGENAAAASLDPSFGTAPLNTFKYSSKVFAVPLELLQDSSIDIEAFVFRRGASRIGRITNTKFTTGAGTTEPQGFATAGTVGVTGTTGETTTVINDDLVTLIHSVNAAYRQTFRTGLAFSMADATFKVVRKLKDTAGQPLYLPKVGQESETLMGYPVDVNDDLPVMAANAKSIWFGNFYLGYKVRDGLQVTLLRMDDSGYIKFGQVGFLAIARCGGALVDAGAIKAFQNSAT
jgi:HK97 family phage major capsid protein